MSNIKEIKITNNFNQKSVRFLNGIQYLLEFPDAYTNSQREKIAYEKGVFLLLGNAEAGFWGLPNNNSNRIQGINQDGSSFINNFYSDRSMMFKFMSFSSGMKHLDAAFFHNDSTLTLSIKTTTRGLFDIDAVVDGTYSNGIVELTSVETPYFKNMKAYAQDCTDLRKEIYDDILIRLDDFGFMLPKIMFGNLDSNANEFVILESGIIGYPVLELSSKELFKNVVIYNEATGSELTLNTDEYFNYLKVDCERLLCSRYDGSSIKTIGSFPITGPGTNKIFIYFEFADGSTVNTSGLNVCYDLQSYESSIS